MLKPWQLSIVKIAHWTSSLLSWLTADGHAALCAVVCDDRLPRYWLIALPVLAAALRRMLFMVQDVIYYARSFAAAGELFVSSAGCVRTAPSKKTFRSLRPSSWLFCNISRYAVCVYRAAGISGGAFIVRFVVVTCKPCITCFSIRPNGLSARRYSSVQLQLPTLSPQSLYLIPALLLWDKGRHGVICR